MLFWRLFVIQTICSLTITTTSFAEVLPPHGLTCRALPESYSVCWYYSGINTSYYRNDFGRCDNYHVVSTDTGTWRVLVEFDQVRSELPIDSISVFIWGVDEFPDQPGDSRSAFELSIFDTIPTTADEAPLWGPITAFDDQVPSQGKWVSVPVRRILTSSGKLYAQFRWISNTPTAPLPGRENTSGNFHTYNGCIEGSRVTWTLETRCNVLIRLSYNLPDTSGSFPLPSSAPDSFTVYLADKEATACSTAVSYLSLRDSMHLSIPGTSGSGNFLAVAAWKNGEMSPRTPAIYLDQKTDVEGEFIQFVPNLFLGQNFPNPFNSSTTVYSQYASPIVIYNILGQVVRVITPTTILVSKIYLFSWDGIDNNGASVSSGVYLYVQPEVKRAAKMILIK